MARATSATSLTTGSGSRSIFGITRERTIVAPARQSSIGSNGISSSCAPSCEPLSFDAHPDADGNVTLRLTPPVAGPGYTTYLIRPSVILN